MIRRTVRQIVVYVIVTIIYLKINIILDIINYSNDKHSHKARASKEDQYRERFRCQRNLNTLFISYKHSLSSMQDVEPRKDTRRE